MALKGTKFKHYSTELKLKAVKQYEDGCGSYVSISEELGLRSSTQLKEWVKKYRNGELFDDQRGKSNSFHPFTGRPKTKFDSIEEERDYLKAQVEYLKKRLSKYTGGGIIPKGVRFEILNEMKARYPLTMLIQIAKVSRAGFYKWRKSILYKLSKTTVEDTVKSHIEAIHAIRPYYGYPRVTDRLRDEGLVVNHKKVYRIMKELDIKSVIRKKRKYYGKEASNVYPNLLNRQFKQDLPNVAFATDITYIKVGDRFYYLSVIQDLYNNEIVSWKCSNRNDLKLVIETVKDLCKKRNVYGSILHSDQGFQYTSIKYSQFLEKNNLLGSHSRKGNCLDNACVESFFSHFKCELVYLSNFNSEQELIQEITEYIQFYNYERTQKRLNRCSPVKYRLTTAA
ncbi:IS3 family transposase [Gottfriedia sp. S16(2024)]|uniref:IS3 family transposase n=1 Tax=Bacillus sp. FJAT-25509 TaxID=1712029 RepID=UPI0012E160E3|nr:IS3 family transposase [Bacillus sp. FJAT-25509]